MPLIRAILGIDPGLTHTGWGIINQKDNHLSFIAAGRLSPPIDLNMSLRLRFLGEGLDKIISAHHPDEAAIEETFVNKNALSSLKLGQARGAAMLAIAMHDIPTAEYATNRIKQSVTGYGKADKNQIQKMISVLLPTAGKMSADAADALAVAITHAHSAPVNPYGLYGRKEK